MRFNSYDNEEKYDFCERSPEHVICEINSQVNSDMTYAFDQNQYGQDDHWTYDHPFGDCEDYALTKMQRLHEAGIKSRMVIITNQVNMAYMTVHAVAVVTLNGENLVLDNNTHKVRLLEGYYGAKRWS